MATSRIPGPFRTDSDSFAQDDGGRWPHFGRPSHAHHMPGPVPSHHELSWKIARFAALRGRENVDDLVEDLKAMEDVVLYMYLDTVGKVTVGVGNMLPTVDDAKKLPFVNVSTGEPATEAEVEAAYDGVSRMAWGKFHGAYRLKPSIELTEDDALQLSRARLRDDFLPKLRRFFPDFDDYPPSARRFMVDMAYNGGVGFFAKRQMDGLINSRSGSR